MDIIQTVKEELRNYQENIKKILNFIKNFMFYGKDIAVFIYQNTGTRKNSKFFKNDSRGIKQISNLSKQDIRLFKHLAKKYDFQFALTPDITKKQTIVNRLIGRKEIPEYKVIYFAKDSAVVEQAVQELHEARVKRQLSKDPKDRSDFNKDGVIDERDLNIETKEVVEDGFEYGKEYGTDPLVIFQKEKMFCVEINKDAFVNKQHIIAHNFSSYSAQYLKNTKGEDVFYLTLPFANKKAFDVLVNKGEFLEKDIIRMELNYDGLSMDTTNQIQMQMDRKEYKDFIKQYGNKGIPYTSYEINNRKGSKEYMVTFNVQDAKKIYKSDTKLKDFKDLDIEIEKTKDEMIDTSIDLGLSDIEMDKE